MRFVHNFKELSIKHRRHIHHHTLFGHHHHCFNLFARWAPQFAEPKTEK